MDVFLDKQNSRFVCRNGGVECWLHFKKNGLYEMDFDELSIGSPNDFNLVEELLRNAFIYAQKEGIKVIPTDERVKNYLDRHGEFKALTGK